MAAVAIALGGCGDDGHSSASHPDLSPLSEVERAGRVTFGEDVLTLRLLASSPGGDYVASGLIEPRGGRFRVEIGTHHTGAYMPSTVIGLDGEGFEGTVAESLQAFDGRPRRCWSNPHAPVGSSPETISVEQATRLLGAVLESLGSETESAKSATGEEGQQLPDTYEIQLASSASVPRDDFKDSKKRLWGDRALLTDLAEPLTITVGGGGTIDAIGIELGSYRPFGVFRRSHPVKSVSIRAELGQSDDALKISPPRCQAIE